MEITDEKKSVVVGLWRQGNTYKIIAHLTYLTDEQVEGIIIDYNDYLERKKKRIANHYPINLN